MGWARLSHRRGLADFGPKWLGRSRHNTFLSIPLGSGRTWPRNLGWARYSPTQHPLHEQWAWIIITPTVHVNSRTCIIIHAYCSRSEQQEIRRRGGRGRGRGNLPGVRVVWPRRTTWCKRWQWWRVEPSGLLLLELQVLLAAVAVGAGVACGWSGWGESRPLYCC